MKTTNYNKIQSAISLITQVLNSESNEWNARPPGDKKSDEAEAQQADITRCDNAKQQLEEIQPD